MIVTYELAGVCPNGHAVQGVTTASVRVNLRSLVDVGAGPNLYMFANCLHLCDGGIELRHMELDAASKLKVDERRAAIRAKRTIMAMRGGA